MIIISGRRLVLGLWLRHRSNVLILLIVLNRSALVGGNTVRCIRGGELEDPTISIFRADFFADEWLCA